MRRIAKSVLRSIPWHFAGIGLASGIIEVMCFPSYSVWGLIFVAFVPLILGLLYAKTLREVAWMGAILTVSLVLFGMTWVSYVVTNFGGLPWIVGAAALVIFSLFSELQCFVFALAAYALLKRVARTRSAGARALVTFGLLPLTYIGLDFMNPKIFPTTLGHALYPWLPVVQIIEYTGAYWLTFPILVANFAVASLIVTAAVRLGLKKPGGEAAAGLAGPRSAVVALVAVCLFLFFSVAWGHRRIAELEAIEKSYTRQFKVSVIQGNIGDIDKLTSEKGYEPSIQYVLRTYRGLTLESIERFHPDLVIWPETAYPFLYTHLADRMANAMGTARDGWIKDLVDEIKTPLYFGSYSSVNKRDFNTAFLVKPPYELAGVYRKSILLAFGEYVPLGPLSPFVLGLVPSIADFGRGPGPITLDVKGVKLGPQICYEGIVPSHSRGSVLLGADILLNITNDSWFGLSTEPWFHMLLTAFRSIELRRPLIRSTNTGFSALIGITGEQRFRTRLFEAGSIDTAVRLPGAGQKAPETFYLRHGELFAGFCQVIAILVLAWMFGPALLSWNRRKTR